MEAHCLQFKQHRSSTCSKPFRWHCVEVESFFPRTENFVIKKGILTMWVTLNSRKVKMLSLHNAISAQKKLCTVTDNKIQHPNQPLSSSVAVHPPPSIFCHFYRTMMLFLSIPFTDTTIAPSKFSGMTHTHTHTGTCAIWCTDGRVHRNCTFGIQSRKSKTAGILISCTYEWKPDSDVMLIPCHSHDCVHTLSGSTLPLRRPWIHRAPTDNGNSFYS